jgi:hypothetical protein
MARTRRGALVVAAALVGSLVLGALPAAGITFGTIDTNNLYRNVGALIADWDEESPGPDLLCSGTLIDEDVFLTAAHCTFFLESEGIEEVWVTFDLTYDEEAENPSGLIAGEYHHHPLFTNFSGPGGNADPHDVAVVVLDEPVVGVDPAELPTVDQLGDMGKEELRTATFAAVGYGVVREEKTKGPNALFFDATRRYAFSSFMVLRNAYLQLSMQPSHEDGGTCFGDSGGPHFLGTSKVIVSITSGGDSACRATDQTYRIDTASVLNFLIPFVD